MKLLTPANVNASAFAVCISGLKLAIKLRQICGSIYGMADDLSGKIDDLSGEDFGQLWKATPHQ